jgi:hypothetical protein
MYIAPPMNVYKIIDVYQKDIGVTSPSELYDNSFHANILRGYRQTSDTDFRWKVPIIAYQNRYFSSTIDDWSGTEVDIGDGYILSNMLAAGSKNADNQFSGIVMGDWREDNKSLSSSTGLYGFDKGQMVFAFKDDGTAFMGKSGSGRIEFDGNSSVITSSGFKSGG